MAIAKHLKMTDGTIVDLNDGVEYIGFFLDFSNNSTVLDFTANTSITVSGTLNAKEYFIVENGIKRTITKNEFMSFEKSGVKCFFILKCKTYDNDGYTYTEQFAWEFIPAYVSSSNHLPNYGSSNMRKILAYGGNSSRGFGAGYMQFDLVNDNATTGSYSYYRV